MGGFVLLLERSEAVWVRPGWTEWAGNPTPAGNPQMIVESLVVFLVSDASNHLKCSIRDIVFLHQGKTREISKCLGKEGIRNRMTRGEQQHTVIIVI